MNTIIALTALVLVFIVYALLTAGRKHRPCTRCLEDEDAPLCDTCPLARLQRHRDPIANNRHSTPNEQAESREAVGPELR